MPKNLNCTTPPTRSFAGLPVCTRLEELETEIAIIGIRYVRPYPQLWTTAATCAQLIISFIGIMARRDRMGG